MRNRIVIACVILCVVALAISGGSLWAAPLPPNSATLQRFEKPEWGVSLEYPAGWTAEDRGDMVQFTSDDYAVFRLIRDETYLDMEQDLSAVVRAVLNRIGLRTKGLLVEPRTGAADRREALVWGVGAAYLVGWEGSIAQFVQDDMGYVIFCTAPARVFPEQQDALDAIALSLKFASDATPTPAVTGTPTPQATATP